MRVRRVALGAAMLAALVGLPAGTVAAILSPGGPNAPYVTAADWITYHHDAQRTGDGVLTGTFSSLTPRLTWTLPTTGPDAGDQLYGPPVVLGSVAYVATLENRVYAISLRTGATLWSQTLGTTYTPPPPNVLCGDIRPNVGIVSSPVIDPSRNELFVVGDVGTPTGPVHHLWSLALNNGQVDLNRIVDPPGQDPQYLLQRVSLAVDDGRVIFGFGGNGGDCGTYHGWVVSVPETGTGAIDRFEVASGTGQGRGAVWMGGGAPVVLPDGNVLVADGNGNATSPSSAYDRSDAVLKLSPTMQLLGLFAPSTWPSDNLSDLDLGSGQPQLLPDGKVLQVGKTHLAYVLDPSNLGGITASPTDFTVCNRTGNQPDRGDGGDALVGADVVIPCLFGLDEVSVQPTSPFGQILWNQPLTNGPPVYAGGYVWSVKASRTTSTLYALDPATGAVALQASLGPIQNNFPTPAIGDNSVLVTTETQLDVFTPA